MVPDLMRDHVRLREIARRVKAVLQIAIERKIDVELLVVRAVERAHRRLSHAAGRARETVVEDKRRRPVLRARALEDLAPHILGAAEHLGDELAKLVVRRALLPLRLRRGGGVRRAYSAGARVGTQEKGS